MATSTDSCSETITNESNIAEQNAGVPDEPAQEQQSIQTETPEKKTRGRGRGTKRKSEADVIAEAKAAFGDLNQAEGRQLRKRAEPPKVEKKVAPTRKGTLRKSVSSTDKQEKPDTSEAAEEALEQPSNNLVEEPRSKLKETNGVDVSLSNGSSTTELPATELESHEEAESCDMSGSKPDNAAPAENGQQPSGTKD